MRRVPPPKSDPGQNKVAGHQSGRAVDIDDEIGVTVAIYVAQHVIDVSADTDDFDLIGMIGEPVHDGEIPHLADVDLIALRMDRLREHYPWLQDGLAYFHARLSQAPEDATFALDWVTRNAHSRADQELAIGALRAKCDILWAQLDALYFAYVQPGWPPPGAFQMETP